MKAMSLVSSLVSLRSFQSVRATNEIPIAADRHSELFFRKELIRAHAQKLILAKPILAYRRLAKIESKTRKATLCPPTSPRVQACDLGIELGVLSLLSLYPTGFRKQEVLLAQGEGASARLFRGSLPSGLAVAVKRVNRSSEIEYSRRNPFTTEFATVVGHLRHKNLVQLRRVMLLVLLLVHFVTKKGGGNSVPNAWQSDPSPWPISGSLGALATTVGGVMYMHSFQGGATLLSLGLLFILYTMFVWWRDVLRESTLEGHHTKVVQLGLRYGFILFIVSEVMFFFAFFWAFFHSSLAPTVEIGGIWPPKGIGVLDPWEIPFLNTLILLSSGAAVTWAHHAILAGKEKRAVYALAATVLLALVFTGFQGMEYYQAPFTISDSIYGSTFFLATGFHGFHVIIGTLFLIICGIRQYLGHLTKEHHVGFEATAWYWHFVDVERSLIPQINYSAINKEFRVFTPPLELPPRGNTGEEDNRKNQCGNSGQSQISRIGDFPETLVLMPGLIESLGAEEDDSSRRQRNGLRYLNFLADGLRIERRPNLLDYKLWRQYSVRSKTLPA
ncbi:hypothetical protein DKX38_006229 [Salix brachista]|uniref:Cytochrome c oxidase subunit 3 n=1 Tax=Salix brachista TaxID=2182728 RepID=A0A5N5N1X5_9ROSI|nr:hypothetical protein DKX38_006229 [Salix brachista]